jgi:hypothetical protein
MPVPSCLSALVFDRGIGWEAYPSSLRDTVKSCTLCHNVVEGASAGGGAVGGLVLQLQPLAPLADNKLTQYRAMSVHLVSDTR